MTDQCKHCTVRGDIKSCRVTPCHKHEDWYSKQLQAELDAANAHVAALHHALNDQVNDCINFDGSMLTVAVMERSTKVLVRTPPQSLADIQAEAIHDLRQQGFEFSVEFRFTDKWAISTTDIDDYANKLIGDNNG